MKNAFIYGWIVLFSALLINLAARFLGMTTWHGYLEKMSDLGFYHATLSCSVPELFFLYFVYPILLGLVVLFIFSMQN
jgi:hypothetical protein